jgi:hypothetical protein
MSTLLTQKTVNVIVTVLVLLLAVILTPVSAKQTRNKDSGPAEKRQAERRPDKTTAINSQKTLPSKIPNAPAARAAAVTRARTTGAEPRNPGRNSIRSRISTGLQTATSPLLSVTEQAPKLSRRLRPQSAFDAKKPGKDRSLGTGRNVSPEKTTSIAERIFNRPTRQRSIESGPAVPGRTDRGTEFRRSNTTSKIIYEDRNDRNFHRNYYEHIYRDSHDRLCHRVIWPRYFFSVFYNFGSCAAVNYVYPYYHHRYVFVSLGGYWPFEYTYLRYYWYPSHLYYWYGYYPVARELKGDTYNYYTYNYYTGSDSYSQEGNGTGSVDQNTFADVREKLARQQAPPDAETAADTYFDEAVKAFEAADYAAAAQKFAAAMELAPEDTILPFALAQALFADEKYADAAGVIRAAMENVTPEKEGVFYPRGLYVDENVLSSQIQLLSETAKLHFADRQMQLLLGYQLLGTGEIERSIEALTLAAGDPQNAKAATVLLGLAEKIKAENALQNSN